MAASCHGQPDPRAAATLGYWVLWFFVDRSIVASDSTAQYVAFEQAFPLSDAFLMVAAALAALRRIVRRSRTR